MINWILSSSVLILVLIALRYILHGKISPRLQYALWALVLVRLLVPVSFGSTGLSVNNLSVAVREQPAVQNVLELGRTIYPRRALKALMPKWWRNTMCEALTFPSLRAVSLKHWIMRRMS